MDKATLISESAKEAFEYITDKFLDAELNIQLDLCKAYISGYQKCAQNNLKLKQDDK